MRMRKLYLRTLSNSCEWNVYVCQESRPGIPPSHHQRSPSPFLLDSYLHSTHLSLSTSSAVPHLHCLYIPSSLITLSSWIVYMYGLVCVCVIVSCIAVHAVLCSRRQLYYRRWCPVFVICLVFCLLAFLFILQFVLTCFWTQTPDFLGAPCSHSDRI